MKKLTVFIGPILLLFVWGIVSWFGFIDEFFLPGPIETLVELVVLLSEKGLIQDLLATLERVWWSFAIAVVLGLPLGLFLGRASRVYKSVEFIIDFFRSTPATALFPLFLLVFGVGDLAKIAVAAFASFLIIIFNVAYGVMHSKKSRVLAAQMMGASKWQIFRSIIFWESLPQTLVGLRNSISISLILIIVTEMFIGTNIGLGRKIIDFQITYNIEAMYATILLVGTMGYLLNLIFVLIEKRYLRWASK